jgi:integrase
VAWAERISGSRSWRGGWRTPDSKKHYTSRKTHPEHPYARKSDALNAAREAEVRAQRRASVDAGTLSASITWGELWDLTKPPRPDSDTGLVEAETVELHLRPKWGATPINTIKRRAVQRWVTGELTPNRAPRTVRRIYAVFQASMNRAVAEEILDASPCVKIELPKVVKRPKPYVDEAHLAALAESNDRGRAHLRDPAQRDLVELGFETGLRPGELCGMHADQVDVAAGCVWVTHVYVKRMGVIRGWPKDKDARRVPLTARAAEILRARLGGRDLTSGCGLRHTDGKSCKSDLVFRNRRGDPITPHALYQALSKAAKRADVPARSPYAYRRGFATWAAEGGLDPFAIAAIMGHEDIEETVGYVQQTSAARDRLRAARGEGAELRVVDGSDQQFWGKFGADPAKQAAATCRTEDQEDAE